VLDIETLRGVSTALVLIAHLDILLPWPDLVFGFTSNLQFGAGVDMFFVISGYVITRSLFRRPHGNATIAESLGWQLRSLPDGRMGPALWRMSG
jgi:peptidoglycan/LPS O-acetylase OafA/YrhL